MSDRNEETRHTGRLDRRSLISAAAGLATAAASLPALSADTERALRLAADRQGRRGKVSFPYDTFRDWMQALDDHGLLMRIAAP